MKKNNKKYVSLSEYIKQALTSAKYEIDNSLGDIPCVVAEIPDLPGCYTQAENFEEARENLLEAIELWVLMAFSQNEELPTINSCALLNPASKGVRKRRLAVVDKS